MRRFLVWFFRRVISLYFRHIEESGNRPNASTAGRIFVSNHVNALVDPILVLTRAPCPISPIAKSTLWDIPGLHWILDAAGAVPIQRRRDNPNKSAAANEAIFDRIATWLEGGGNILIFPEGTSHNEPQLAAVKSGAARMLMRAYESGARDVSFQSVALEFEARDVFRSRALILYGPVHYVRDFEGDSEARVTAMTEALRDDLSELLVEGDTWPDRLLIARVAEMLANETGDRSMERWNSIGRRVEAANKALQGSGEAAVAKIRKAVDTYYTELERAGLSDHQLGADLPERERGDLAGAIVLLMVLPLALLGMLLYWAPYQMPRLAARKVGQDADRRSTAKLVSGLLAYPAWGAGLAAASFLALPTTSALGAFAVIALSPFAALAWRDVTPGVMRAMRLRTHGKRLARLGVLRERALAVIHEVRDQLEQR